MTCIIVHCFVLTQSSFGSSLSITGKGIEFDGMTFRLLSMGFSVDKLAVVLTGGFQGAYKIFRPL